MKIEYLKTILVMLQGKADDSQTRFRAIEMHNVGGASRKPEKKPNGFDGVVLTSHPVDLKDHFGTTIFTAEMNDSQGVYYIYSPQEAVNLTRLIQEISALINQEFPTASTIFGCTERYGCLPHLTDCSYRKEFSSNAGRTDSYRTGRVVDFAFNKDGKTIFVSIFIGVETINFRIAVLGTAIPDEELKGKLNSNIPNSADDFILDEGEFKPSDDPVTDAKRIVKWVTMVAKKA